MKRKLVLEIGGGHKPSHQSDVVVDKFFHDNTERGGGLSLLRPTIIADGQKLPFRDKAFDRTIGRQVMEHMDDINLFFEELMRVSGGGYLSSPSYLRELLFGWSYHRWLIKVSDGQLVCARKKECQQPLGMLSHYLAANNKSFQKFLSSLPIAMFHVQYSWQGKIDYQIVEQIDLPDFSTYESIREIIGQYEDQSASLPVLKRMLLKVCPTIFLQKVQKLASSFNTRRKPALSWDEIDQLLVCPACHGALDHQKDSYKCQKCHRLYPIDQGVPIFLVD